MDNPSKKETMLFVALPGASPYAELPKREVRDQLEKGKLKQSALIWSQKHNTWKQARHITQLIAGQLQPRQVQPKLSTQAPRAAATEPKVAAEPTARTSTPSAAAQAKAAVSKGVAPKAGASVPGNPLELEKYSLEQPHKTPVWLKGLCGALAVIIVGLLALNYYYVHSAMKSFLAEDNTPFKNAPVYAHLGGFFQARDLVIHLPPSSLVTKENFLQYLGAISAATPNRPFTSGFYNTVSIGPGWGTPYHIQGRHWRRLGKADITDEDRKAILLDNLFAGSEKLIPKTSLDAGARAAFEEKRWNDFVAAFAK